MNARSRWKLLDSLYIGALVLYVLAGLRLVPFHGDEATTIYVSRDWYILTQAHDLDSLVYRDLPFGTQARTDQDLRLINGVMSKYAIGLAGSLMGWTIND